MKIVRDKNLFSLFFFSLKLKKLKKSGPTQDLGLWKNTCSHNLGFKKIHTTANPIMRWLVWKKNLPCF